MVITKRYINAFTTPTYTRTKAQPAYDVNLTSFEL